MAWDLVAAPYEGPMLSALMLFMDTTKLLASVGFILLCVPSLPEQFSSAVFVAEIATFVSAVGVGMALAVAHKVLHVHERKAPRVKALEMGPSTLGGMMTVDPPLTRRGANVPVNTDSVLMKVY